MRPGLNLIWARTVGNIAAERLKSGFRSTGGLQGREAEPEQKSVTSPHGVRIRPTGEKDGPTKVMTWYGSLIWCVSVAAAQTLITSLADWVSWFSSYALCFCAALLSSFSLRLIIAPVSKAEP